MRILFLSSRIPYPPDRGDKVRSLFILNTLAAMGELTLVSLVQPKSDSSSMAFLQANFPELYFVPHGKIRSLINLILNIFSQTPFQVAYYRNSALKKLLSKLFSTRQYDLVYTHLIRMAPYVRRVGKARVILDYTDCISLEYKRSLSHRQGIMKLFFAVEANRTQHFEQRVKNSFNENWVISPVDLAALKLDNSPKSAIIPNMVQIPSTIPLSGTHMRLIFCGNMSVAHNISAAISVCEQIMPLMLQKYPMLKFYIVGASPVPVIKALQGKNNTFVMGFVPDLNMELQASDLFIAPLYFSAGIQNKVLEAMAAKIPVLTTPNVADSMGCVGGRELLVASNSKEFAHKAEELLDKDSLRKSIGESGYLHVAKFFSREAVTALIHQRVNELVKK